MEKDDRHPCLDPKEKGKKAAASGWGIPVLVDETSEDASPAPVHVSPSKGWKWPRSGAWNFGASSSAAQEPCDDAAEEAISTDEPCLVAPVEASPIDEPYVTALKDDPLPEDTLPTEETLPKEDPAGEANVTPQTTREALQAESIIEGFGDVEEHTSHTLDDHYEPTPKPDVTTTHSAPGEDADSLAPPPWPALCPQRGKSDIHSPPPSLPSSIGTSALEAASPQAPTEDGHAITLKILIGSKVLRAVVFVRTCTRTAILDEARAFCVKSARGDRNLEMIMTDRCTLALMSLRMYGCEMDLSTYKVESLSSLVRAVEKTGIPRFTLRISEM